MSPKSRPCSENSTSKNGCMPCNNTFRRSLRSPRSNSDFKRMLRRNFPMRNGARISGRSSKRSSMSWVRRTAAMRNKRNSCALLQEANPPEEVMKQAERELKRLDFIPPASPEFSVIVSYIEIIADLPWNKFSKDDLDLDQAQQILDRDHYDLEKVKKRLIVYLAVRKLNPQGHGAILCFLGPPGVGKTSLGQSIADALGRKFVRISLGGMRDEAEIRGHRRTYIGSMPGRIVQELRRCGTRNPVFMLDEIDK